MYIHEKIRLMREAKQWTQEEVAEKLAMSAGGYARIERGESQPSLARLNKIAGIFHVDLADLLSDEGQFLLNINGNDTSFHFSTLCQFHFASDGNQRVRELELLLSHKETLLQEKEQLLAQQAREIQTLHEMLALLKK